MSSKFEELLRKHEDVYTKISQTSDLLDLKTQYSEFELIREELTDFVTSNFSEEDAEYNYFFKRIERKESQLFEKYGGVPVFDDETSDDEIENVFDEYSSYFQRYGCLDYDQVISWDSDNFLIEDELGNLEIVIRPDKLMR
jgi:hypothetical protein